MNGTRYLHLVLHRSEPLNPRRRRTGRGPVQPDDPAAHARKLAEELEAHRAAPPREIPGFDPRRLLKLSVTGVSPDDLEAIPGLSVVSQEGKSITILFATEAGLEECRRRLARLAAGRSATRKDLFWAIDAIRHVVPEDRTGPALAAQGRPALDRFTIDVELWPLELATERERMLDAFRRWSPERDIRVLDQVNNAAVVLLRIQTAANGLDALLNYRDVRQVDLPPRYQMDFGILRYDIQQLPPFRNPDNRAPGVVVLDSGLATNHPLLGPAIGDSQGFCGEDDDGSDTTGHGTAVAGLALHSSIEFGVEQGIFDPKLRLFSGRVVSTDDPETELIENRIRRAVEYFQDHYGSRVFNLSFGDSRKPYKGGHVDRLAATLDSIAHERRVLFVVSTGNFLGGDGAPEDWRREYPGYLLQDSARLLDPAPALNVLTIGSLARLERSRQAIAFPDDPAHQPISRRDEPSPFTRSGPGPLGAIKPELVEYGGNLYVDTRAMNQPLSPSTALGEICTSAEFATGSLFTLECGTSYATPKVANAAALLLTEYPEASTDLLRALLVAHARVPDASIQRLTEAGDRLRLVGYGIPRVEASLFSLESRATLVSEEAIGPNQHHFYEIPLTEGFFQRPARRLRRVTVALAHMPAVRRTRIEYRAAKLSFRVVSARSLGEVTQAYRRLREDEEEPSIPEQGFSPGPRARDGGTIQCATRLFRQVDARHREAPYFIVVTHQVPPWVAQPDPERYALVVVIEDLSGVDVQLYSQIREELRARARARART